MQLPKISPSVLQHPRTPRVRRLLFHIHRWLGVVAAAYVLLVSISGAVLVFRIDLQRALAPNLFRPKADGPPAEFSAVLASLARAYPTHRISGIDAPTTSRPVVLAYVMQGREFSTVLVDPVDAQVLGVLPEQSFIRVLQDLHFDLLGGRTGRLVNGVGAFSLLVLCVTGPVIWWPGLAGRRAAMTIDVMRGPARAALDLHRAIGIWMCAPIAMWAVTGIAFVFPSQFQSAVNAVSRVTATRPPSSDLAGTGRRPRPTWEELIDTAGRRMPGRPIARIVLPATERASFQVLFAERAPTPSNADLQSVYLDQYSGAVLQEPSQGARRAGDRILAWVAPLHMGSFGGLVVKVLWLTFGIAPAVLAVTGSVLWWNRRPRN